MMLWCELHNTSGVKGGGITNFDPTEYEKDLAWLQTITQARVALPSEMALVFLGTPDPGLASARRLFGHNCNGDG